MDKNSWYRRLPKVDSLLKKKEIIEAIALYGRAPVVKVIQEQLELVRNSIDDSGNEDGLLELLNQLDSHIMTELQNQAKYHLKRVINGTGIVLHTNLGRAPLNRAHVKTLTDLLSGYSNLEYDLSEGKRGERYSHFEEIICSITGAEAAVAVNNNAAAVLLMIAAVCSGREVIVSRGEQVEIGGKFRIPEVIRQSGARLIEVGTTNRTRLSDYEENITGDTGAILKVHTSNYKITGFTENVSVKELAKLSKNYELPIIVDLGSGVLVDLSKFGLPKEPTVMDTIEEGADLVSFSGDKLLGGPQAGIIAGKKKWIDIIKKHPLMRALRIDKFTASLLEMTFACYRDEANAVHRIPVLNMLTRPLPDILSAAMTLIERLEPLMDQYCVRVADCSSICGGGALPGEEIPSKAVVISGEGLKPNEAEKALRSLEIPIIICIEEDNLIIDMRTVFEEETEALAMGLIQVLTSP